MQSLTGPRVAGLLLAALLIGAVTFSVCAEDEHNGTLDDEPDGRVSLTASNSYWDTSPPPAPVWDDPLPPLDEELWLHGGSSLYAPEGDRWGWPEHDEHVDYLRLPENWEEPTPLTAFTEFLGADAIRAWPGWKWFGEDGFQWEPRFVGYGSYELFGIASEQAGVRRDGIGHQLIADLDLRLTGTERVHVQFRPLGRDNSGGSIYRFNNPAGYDDNSTGIPDRYWFEGEFFSIVGGLVDQEFTPRDVHFVFGKFPFSLHNRLLINDELTGIAINKNTILLDPFSNINLQFFYAFDDVDRPGTTSPDLYGLHATADYQHWFLEATIAYLENQAGSGRSASYAAFSATQFFGPLTLTGRMMFKGKDKAGSGSGELYVVESNYVRESGETLEEWTGVEEAVFYANVFGATRGWNAISGGNFDRLRASFEIDPLVSIIGPRPPEETFGVATGVQLFRCHEDESFTPEFAYEEPDNTPVFGLSLRYQRKLGLKCSSMHEPCVIGPTVRIGNARAFLSPHFLSSEKTSLSICDVIRTQNISNA